MDRNTLLAFFLIAIVLIFTPMYMETFSPSPEPAIVEDTGLDSTHGLPIGKKPNATKTVKQKPEVFQLTSPTKADLEEKLIELETNLYNATVSTKGGGSIVSFSFNNYFDQDSQQVNLINGINKENLSIRFQNLDGDPINLGKNWSYNGFLGGSINSKETLKFSTEISPGQFITKSLTFRPDSYVIDISVDAQKVQSQVFSGNYSIGWYGGLPPTEKNEKDDFVYFKSYVFQGGELEEVKIKEGETESQSFNGSTDWVAIRTKYFITSLVPNNPGQVTSAAIGGSFSDREAYDMELLLPASDISNISLYLGPLEYDRIKNIGQDLDRVMNFGIAPVRPLAKGVLWVLKKMHDIIPNYGYILILFAFFVKLLVYPLTKKSYQSTTAMQQIQPEITALKEKHKNNPQKLNTATMQLYKEKGVNPLGGCLPMLLQMPLLFALFVVFRTTIELRAEPFVFWITDLSAPDAVYTLPFSVPIYGSHVAILPVLMVVSMFIQQRMMSGGAAQQPQQKTMQYFMTGFFFLMFNSFPSGLNLYYTLFNVLTIAQQKLIPPTDTASV
jgi:YidC/Oxa1 family membrane protein insertase